jgi:DNA-binding NarL/FixJ family response regulator
MITISIVEDHAGFRTALSSFLRSDPKFSIKGLYVDGNTAEKGLINDRPDIAIIDIMMPGINGIELISAVRPKIPETQFMICTAHYDNDNIFQALRAGASGYILKDENPQTIMNAVVDLHGGGAPMSPYIARKVISFMQANKSGNDYGLTIREKEILHQLAKGLLYKEIADRMFISPTTVKNHLNNIYRKLHVQNKTEALKKYQVS